MSRTFLMGDIHGKWQFVENLCKKKDTAIKDKVILLGGEINGNICLCRFAWEIRFI